MRESAVAQCLDLNPNKAADQICFAFSFFSFFFISSIFPVYFIFLAI